MAITRFPEEMFGDRLMEIARIEAAYAVKEGRVTQRKYRTSTFRIDDTENGYILTLDTENSRGVWIAKTAEELRDNILAAMVRRTLMEKK